jgi:Ca2+-binding EF-hand superfamily protein
MHRLDANGDGKLSADELRCAQRVLRKYDLNEDESLDLAELLSGAPDRKPGPPSLKAGRVGEKDAVLRIDLGAKPGARLRNNGGREAQLRSLGGWSYRLRGPGARWWLTFRAERAAPDVRSAGDFLVAQFKAALGGNKNLSKTDLEEDATLAGFLDLFPYADRDGDGRLSLAELERYLRLVEAGLRAQVWVTATDRGRSPFHFLDRDGDGRLSCRELLSATDLLGGKAEIVGLPHQFDLAFGGPPVRVWGGVAVPTAKLPPRKVAAMAVPAWFRAMDRNGDGFVSRAEFIGPPEVFRELDADGDGLISAAEAARASGR